MISKIITQFKNNNISLQTMKNPYEETEIPFNGGNVPPHYKDDDSALWSESDLELLDEREQAKEDAIQAAHDSYDSWKDEILANEPITNNNEGGMQC